MLYSPLVNLQTSIYYDIQVNGWGLNGQKYVWPKRSSPDFYGTVDTGTMMTLIPHQAFQAVSSQKCDSDFDCLLTLELSGACLSMAEVLTCDLDNHVCKPTNLG